MDARLTEWQQQWQTILREFRRQAPLGSGQIVVVGCSTSEVLGERIGTAGSTDVAAMLFAELDAWRRETGIELAFQCCEHLNRALVVERETARVHGLEIVSVIPVPQAGGAMAAYAYRQLEDPVVVEAVRADAGIDIGHTLIGMHLKPVAVPVRVSVKHVGHAYVTLAKTRPKLIGGARAVYTLENPNNFCSF
ncbi:TIGR01440 family protein [Geobacillus sp. DSP4a]|uniref:TIGR01440 family protein n=1 Tax=Geobacillus sp. DSP4a TaxID=2508873 RepID=UPI001492289D|nr:TIGR01440 family protein [Geobacillus sp. DSP4a]NNU98221.1 TIGR01440 family protein [Geobacillus sp. DSP4a]